MATSKPPCGPCEYDYINKDAYKWCTICDEGFCKDCQKMHRTAKISRDHKLISIQDYLKLSNISVRQSCDKHEQTFDSYCKKHDKALCLSCVLSDHKSCGNIIRLVDAAKNAKRSTALVDLEETILVGLQNIQRIIKNTNPAYLDKQEKIVKDEIREVRHKINHRLDEMEKKLILDLESKFTEYKSRHSAVLNHMKESEKMMKRIKEQLTELKQMASDLQIFLGTRQINREVYECLKSTSEYNVTDKYNVKVEIEPVLTSLLNEIRTFGNITPEVTKINIPVSQPKIGQAQKYLHPSIKSVTGIGVKLKQQFTIEQEFEDMNVTGCTILPNGRLLIADYSGKEQLMQYNQDGTHVRDIPVSSEPFDVTVIDTDRVAVSYGRSQYIEILNIKKTTVEKKVKLDNNTWGLSYQGRKLYLVVEDRGIVIIDLSGKIVNTIDIAVNNMCHLTTTADRIYYSVWYRQTVACCDMTGKQIWEFQDESVENPTGVTVDNNQNVFVVGSSSSNVTLISRDGKTSKPLLTECDGMHYPRAIYYSQDNGNLLVCNEMDQTAALCKVI